jgi:hypothetical protein
MATLNTIITLRQGTTAEWADSKVILALGEAGLEYLADGSVKIKAGDGEHAWADLKYIGSDVKAANVFQVELGENDMDDIAAIEAQVASESAKKQDGDVAIVKTLISEGKYSYTSYVYETSLDVEGENSTHGWSAMDGNYSAANVFLKDQIVLAGDYGQDSRKDKITSIGNLRIGDEIAAGTSLQSLLMDMLSQRLQPSITTNPSISVTLNQAGAYEVGTEITPTFSVSGNDGAYTYEATTGVTFSGWEVKTSGRKTVHEGSSLSEESATSTSGSFTKFTVAEDTNYKLTASANGTAGNIAKDNLGDTSNPAIQIAAKDGYTANSSAITGYRALFYGWFNSAALDPNALTSANIRTLATTGTVGTTDKP